MPMPNSRKKLRFNIQLFYNFPKWTFSFLVSINIDKVNGATRMMKKKTR